MRDIPVGNGSLLVTFDEKYQIREIYFPHVGQENHTKGFPFRFGIWKNGSFSWIFSDEWQRSLSYLPNCLVSDVWLKNESLKIELRCNDTVVSDKNIFLRKISIFNGDKNHSDIRIFLHHDFRILETKIGDCAFYHPSTGSIVHYKKTRYFLIKTKPDFNSFAIGRKAFRNLEGTWRDAEDGSLHLNGIAEGSIDSTIQVSPSAESSEIYYWICAGRSLSEVEALNLFVETESPEELIERNKIFWANWLGEKSFADLSEEIIELYKRSLLIIRTQIDNEGAILAANDSDVSDRATDHYSYLWTRDGAFVAYALDLAGYPTLTRKFFEFCAKILHPDGYFLQRYNPDGSVASSWHPFWDTRLKKLLVPIQEDETALVLWALWKHYEKYQDIEFIHELYEPMIKKCADFMVNFQLKEMKLPKSSWNLWEDRRGIHTFTVSSVISALRAASEFAKIFGDKEKSKLYKQTAEDFTEGLLINLYCKKNNRFLRSLETSDDENFKPDETIDSSLCGLFYFEVLPTKDEKVVNTIEAIRQKLWINTEIGGIARYENDEYMRTSKEVTGNAWINCTLWLADYYIASAEKLKDLKPALDLLLWTTKRALPSGILSEQIDPITGKQLSVSPLTWSHSSFVATVQHYLKKFYQLNIS
jgi:oligosaccharide amylase